MKTDNILSNFYQNKQDSNRMNLHDIRIRYEKIAGYCKRGRLLDVGCADGSLRNFLSRTIIYKGLDLAKSEDKDIVQGDALDMPFSNDSFDYVVIPEIIEHVISPYCLLKECKRVLKPNGLLLGTATNQLSFLRSLANMFNLVRTGEKHIQGYSIIEMKNILKMCGFKLIELTTINHKILPKINIDFKIFRRLPIGNTIFFCGRKSRGRNPAR